MKKLEYLRKKYELTQRQVADELGLHFQAYNALEKGRRGQSIIKGYGILKKLSDLYGVTMEELIDEEVS